jgi:hypothetical protein
MSILLIKWKNPYLIIDVEIDLFLMEIALLDGFIVAFEFNFLLLTVKGTVFQLYVN